MFSRFLRFCIYKMSHVNRIRKKFMDLKKKRKKALIIFMTAGDPSLKKTAKLIPAFEKEGVDLIELGVPFSDPLADGPIIQASSQRSLARGTNLKKIIQLVKNVRKSSQIPLVLMSYLNPIWHYGLKRFASEAKQAGVDGVIVPDLPPDEGKEIGFIFKRHGLDLIYLLAPTSNKIRQKRISKESNGFVYYVSLTGVTGMKNKLSETLSTQVRSAKKNSNLPVCVGFGVSTPEQAEAVSKTADGVIIGSAVVSGLHNHRHLDAEALSKKIVRPFAKALRKDR